MFKPKIVFLLAIILSVSACSLRPTGEAKDQFDFEDEEPKIDSGAITGVNLRRSKQKKENDELLERIRRLENNQRNGTINNEPIPIYGDITKPPVNSGNTANNTPSLSRPASSTSSSQSFEEWKRARSQTSADYKEFKEYQEWLEFKKLKKKN